GIDVDQLFYRASKIVPPDIRIVSREKVASDFHARYSATAKTYRYYFSIGPSQEPFRRNFCYEAYPNTDLRRMEVAVKDIIGEHDFTSFAHKAHEGSAKNAPVKIISKAHFGKDEELFFFEVTGNGFLHKMVRNIMGTLFEIGRGKRPVEDMAYLLQIKDRRKAGQTAPAKGLFLVEVQY
ncbi:MAG: tRNA pseudouridine(38-40) synthase TruA, partial [Simkaniaceae bacterium]|nr:tRNA pseudouridine(38-40) synthase TruA [Simkaniaceae bacterium]